MRVLNIGSMNIDYTYRVDRFVEPGETKLACELQVRCGGKGLNQSVALAYAGAEVLHGGLRGEDAAPLLQCLERHGVTTQLLQSANARSGNAIIQVDASGQNCILLYGGTNQMLTREGVDRMFQEAGHVDLLVLQNETNLISYIMERAFERHIPIAFNAAPMTADVREYPLEKVTWLIVNEVEGGQLAQCAPEDSEQMLALLHRNYPNASLLLTLGSGGAKCYDKGHIFICPAMQVPVVDTTAAGDTFVGYFLTEIMRGSGIEQSLQIATKASAICISRAGASDAIPVVGEVK